MPVICVTLRELNYTRNKPGFNFLPAMLISADSSVNFSQGGPRPASGHDPPKSVMTWADSTLCLRVKTHLGGGGGGEARSSNFGRYQGWLIRGIKLPPQGRTPGDDTGLTWSPSGVIDRSRLCYQS